MFFYRWKLKTEPLEGILNPQGFICGSYSVENENGFQARSSFFNYFFSFFFPRLVLLAFISEVKAISVRPAESRLKRKS